MSEVLPGYEAAVSEKRKKMDAKKKVIESAKPLPERVLRKMIATGKSIESKAYEK